MPSITVSDLTHLSLEERLRLVADLWDSIAAEAMDAPERLPVGDAWSHEIRRRSHAHRTSPGEAIPLEEALERVERSLA